MERHAVNIVPLNDSNYATWKIQMKMLLIQHNLFKIVDGSESVPTEVATLHTYKLRRAISPKLLYLIGDPSDPAEVWKTLQNTFQKKTWANKLSLKRKLYAK